MLALQKSRSLKLHPVQTVTRIAWENQSRGCVRTSLLSSSWDISADCTSPVTVELKGAPCTLDGKRKRGWSHTLTMLTRCRKCPACLRRRSRLWAYRAKAEIEAAPRTWFATFTAAPGWQSILQMRASHRLTAGGTDLRQLSPPDQFNELVREFGAEVTKYIKRIRKNTGAAFRYILVAEPHKSGAPHFHALFHEHTEGSLRHAPLTSTWKLGFTKFKVVSGTQSAFYVAKYLAKTAASRVRASLGYGKEVPRPTDSEAVWPPRENLSHLKEVDILGGPRQEIKNGFNSHKSMDAAAFARWKQGIADAFSLSIAEWTTPCERQFASARERQSSPPVGSAAAARQATPASPGGLLERPVRE